VDDHPLRHRYLYHPAEQSGARGGDAPLPAAVGPDETLVPDARCGVSTAQQLDRRLLALLGVGHWGLAVQASGRLGDVCRGPQRGAGLRVLVVGDSRDTTAALAVLLGLWGHDCCTTHDGASALALAATYLPQVVLLDLDLPGLDGYELARRLRATPGVASARLVALSGAGAEGARLRSHWAGCDAHLTKPVGPDALRALLASFDPARG
jgi:CheY-like chemotaxis protein